jgi:phosphatidylserine decarboxylase
MDIHYYDRSTGQLELELVYGDSWVRWLYSTSIGRLLQRAVTSPTFSRLYGRWQDSPLSARKIPSFIQKFQIDQSDYLPAESGSAAHPYPSFNSFFIRRLRAGARSFPDDSSFMGAFSEARYLGYVSSSVESKLAVKGSVIDYSSLLQNSEYLDHFVGGPLLIARLCPSDYHRFHFPDQGEKLASYSIAGPLHSVNPLALRAKGDILTTNERRVTILSTENFGKIAYVEVGAICVGKIVEVHQGEHFQRGEEKGYFLFGGSTVIILGEPGRWKPSTDIVEQSANGIETYIQLGDIVAQANLDL